MTVPDRDAGPDGAGPRPVGAAPATTPPADAPRIALADAHRAAAGAPPPYLNVRFDAARRPVRCAGSTVVAHLDPADRAPFLAVRAPLAAAGLADLWAWLPPASLHMTLFDLLLHDRRTPERWPAAGLPPDASPAEADAFALAALRGARCTAPPPWTLRVLGLEASARSHACITAILAPPTPEADRALRAMRDDWAARAGLSHRPGHAAYVFHVTLAYLVAWPADAAAAARADAALADASAALTAAAPTLTLHRAEVCRFDDMTEFRPAYALPA